MKKEYLYLLECEGFYKIGISNNPKLRFCAIRTANPFEVKPVLCIWSYDRSIIALKEKYLHNKFIKLNHRNEWFKKSNDIKLAILSCVNNKTFYQYDEFVSHYYGIASSVNSRTLSKKYKKEPEAE
jgi:hypothetical protein